MYRGRVHLEKTNKKRAALVDTSSEVDVDYMPPKKSLPTLASGPSGTSTSSQFPSVSATSHQARITQAMILKMEHLAHSADVRDTRLEVVLPWMIESVILFAVTAKIATC